MKATLFFKKIDYNQITTKNPVCTMHTDTINVTGKRLHKLIKSALCGWSTPVDLGELVNQFEDKKLFSIIDASHKKLFGETSNKFYTNKKNEKVRIELFIITFVGKNGYNFNINPDNVDMDNEWQKPYNKINYEKSCEKITNYILTGHV